MNALTIGVWAFAFAVASCALAVLWFVRHNRRMLRATRQPGRDPSGESGADVDGHRKAQSPRERTRKELTDEICIRAIAVAATKSATHGHGRRARSHASARSPIRTTSVILAGRSRC